MRVTLDLDKNIIIVPNTYYAKIDSMNALITQHGGKKLDYIQYIKDGFEKAMSEPSIVRQDDVAKGRK